MDKGNKKNEKRFFDFLHFAYEVDIDTLNHADLWKLRRHLLKILDNDLAKFLRLDFAVYDFKAVDFDKKEVDIKLRGDLKLMQSGFFAFLQKNFLPYLKQNTENIPDPDKILTPSIPEARKEGRFLFPQNGIIIFNEYIPNFEDIGSQQLCQLFSIGIPVDRYYVCEECSLWKINNRKVRKHWFCASCYKKIYDRISRRKERSTPEGRKAYNEKQFVSRWEKYLRDNPKRQLPRKIQEKYLRLKNGISV